MTLLRILRSAWLLCALLPMAAFDADADDSASAVAPVMRLLQSGRVPESRLRQILEQVASRGNARDLAYLYQQAVVEDAYDRELQLQVLEMLVEAGAERGVTPVGDLSGIARLIESSAASGRTKLEQAAIQLAGLWKVPSAAGALRDIVTDPQAAARRREAALKALTRLGGATAREAVLSLTRDTEPIAIRMQGAGALVGLDVELAARRATGILNDANGETDLQDMISAFLDRQGGSDVLAAAIEQSPPSADVARMAMRAMYAVGRSDPKLSSVLGKIAGIDSDPQPLTNSEVLALVPQVKAEGDPARGEDVFRRADLSCMKCHAVSKAGGQVGPDLSAVGASSPIDYILHSISDPDQQIKEAYITRVVVTDEGQVLQGIVENRTEQTLVLKDASGKLVSIPTDAIEDEIEGKSLMPKGLMKFMTRSELIDLAKFLSLLGKPGTEYAIREGQRMQRWRVLTDVDDQFIDEVPDFTSFEDYIYRSTESRPAYARVNGELPLDQLVAQQRQPVLYLVGEVQVTQPGAVGVRLDSADGVTMWVDKQLSSESETATELPVGVFPITLRVDTRQRENDDLRLHLFRPPGSKAEFAVVDGA